MTDPKARPGEIALGFDPGQRAEAALAFIGSIASPWTRGTCPKNLREARDRGGDFALHIAPDYRAGLQGLTPGDRIILLYWTGQARRDLIVQAPGHRPGPTGVFALRSPARPNPVAIAVVTILGLDAQAGRIAIDAIDAFDGTPVLDIKPWLPSVDMPPDAP
jgi:tRNA-Thr(GGU) m(6)t(6)A37 methyltransferase TsaA